MYHFNNIKPHGIQFFMLLLQPPFFFGGKVGRKSFCFYKMSKTFRPFSQC